MNTDAAKHDSIPTQPGHLETVLAFVLCVLITLPLAGAVVFSLRGYPYLTPDGLDADSLVRDLSFLFCFLAW